MDISGEKYKDGDFSHVPVLRDEVLFWLISGQICTLVDGTVGYGGHAECLLEHMGPEGVLVGIDRDDAALAASRIRLSRFGSRVVLLKGDFVDMTPLLHSAGISAVNGVLLDLGVSSPQLDDPGRGFSFQADGPLDMRMDQTNPVTAAQVVNTRSEMELADLIYQYGEERFSRRIARAIVRAREEKPIDTTQALVSVIKGAVPASYRHGRIHCATRTFQALRIVVNRELDVIAPAIQHAVDLLQPGGRLAVISFHSLEDRVVKHTLRALSAPPRSSVAVLTKKPVVPSDAECQANPRARSAKLRVAERLPRESVQ